MSAQPHKKIKKTAGKALVAVHKTSRKAVAKVKPHAVTVAHKSIHNVKAWCHAAIKEEKYGPYVAKTLDWIDRASSFMMDSKGDERRDEVMQTARRPIVFGMWVILLTFGFFGAWSLFAPLDSAAIARGTVVLDSNKKVIQHLEGGIIAQILVREGDHVTAGQPLIRLSETAAKARRETLVAQRNATLALENRLVAERDGASEITFHADLLSNSKDPDIQKTLDTQRRLFATRKEALNGKIDVLKQRIAEANEEIKGLTAQEKSSQSQLKLIRDEIAIVNKLLQTGDANRPRLLALQRREAELHGIQGQYQSEIAKAKQAITEAELEIVNTRTAMQNDVIKELHDVEVNLADLQERVKASQDVLDRVVISAPHAGIINNLVYHTIGGVVSPGSPIMEIIPQDDKLVIDAQVSPQDIDVVHVGLTARIRLTAFKTRTTPIIEGKVVNLSADRLVDKNANNAYYLARIEVDKDMLSRLEDIELYPGMAADVLIVTGSRTFMQYLLSPITDSFRHAFREQ